MKFYVGLHQPSDAWRFDRCMISVNRLYSSRKRRKKDFVVREWMLDSGAFTAVSKYGDHLLGVEAYASLAKRWHLCGDLVAVVSQDYMCEPFVLARTGFSTSRHQEMTIERYDALRVLLKDQYVLPVLQGFWPEEYVSHLKSYGDRLEHGQWVGVGSVCKRNARVEEIEDVLMAIHEARPDLRLHGFGIKLTALESSVVRGCLYSADSMAWSAAARKQGRDANSYEEAQSFVEAIECQHLNRRSYQYKLF